MPDFAARLRRLARSVAGPGAGRPAAGASAEQQERAEQVSARLAELTEARDHEAAERLATESFDELHDQPVFLRQVSQSTGRSGGLSLRVRALEALVRIEQGPKVAARLAVARGRLRETDAAWTPTVPEAVVAALPPAQPPLPGRVVHVLKISVPHRQSGYTMRGMYSLSGQARSGLDPVAVTALDFPEGAVPADGAAAGELVEDVDGIPHVRLLRAAVPAEEPWDAYLDVWAAALAPVVARYRPEVLHVHSGHRGYESALVALTVGELLGVPVVYEVRGFFEALWSRDLAWAERSETYRRRRDTETRCMQRAAAVVTLSESMRQDILERGVDPATVHVVPNGVDTDVFTPRPRAAALTEQLGLTDRFVFGYVSNLDHWREGQELLVDAAVRLREQGVPATALIVGDGTRRAELEQLAERRGAGDAVVFTGKVPHDDVAAYYAQLDVFVVPRVDERAARLVTPLKPFEAMAQGLPLLVSDLPALNEITGDGSRGATFRAGDADSLAQALLDLHADPQRRAALAAAGREWVVAERQWSANGARYREVYDQVAAARPPA
ncbi:glycosyltransferase family 4 protein [Jannaschia sp. R86511]|uniref:glycosyltransferase family 4 protein n=1 Tax=Jannaschia sp. R86511 TaxID=3093853 RepID=UPI0036D2DCF1